MFICNINTDLFGSFGYPSSTLCRSFLECVYILICAARHRPVILCPQTYFNAKVKILRLKAEKAKNDREAKQEGIKSA